MKILKTHCPHGHELTPANSYDNNGSVGCLICRHDYFDRHKAANREKMLTRKNEWQCKHLYGMTIAQRDALLESQGGGCKLCGRTDCHWGKGFQDVWHIDHVHGTKIVRGILCARCNMLVGQMEKNLMLTLEVIKYLKGFSHGAINSEGIGYDELGEAAEFQSVFRDWEQP
jgi:hypothetical protein